MRRYTAAPARRAQLTNNDYTGEGDAEGNGGRRALPYESSLSPCPRSLFELWTEYEFGLGGRKAAKLFTANERGRVKFKYSRRKVLWDCVSLLVRAGHTAHTAIDCIYDIYGNESVTTIINAMRRDRRNGVHAELWQQQRQRGNHIRRSNQRTRTNRENRSTTSQNSGTGNFPTNGDEFAQAFQNVGELSDKQKRRSKEIEERVRREMREDNAEFQREEFSRTGLFTSKVGPNELTVNHGDSSNLGREMYARRLEAHLQETPVVGGGRAKKPTAHGLCDIMGCNKNFITPDHKCSARGCTKYVHGLCAAEKGLMDEAGGLKWFCGVACKSG